MLTQTQLSNFLYTAPWWIHVVMVGIVISGFLSLKYSLQDKQFDDEWIEKEGEVYIERMEKERKKKERSNK